MLRFALLVALCGAAVPASAQIIRSRNASSAPSTWVSFSAGAFSAGQVDDGRSQSSWDFGNTTSVQYRGTVEMVLQGGSSLGLLATYARAPIVYSGGFFGGGASCYGCSAHVDLYQLMATFHAGGGIGFHQVIDASAGIHTYDNFRRDSDGSELAPGTANNDFAFTVGYGFGYGLSQTMQINIVQDFGLAIHERDGLSANQNNSLRMQATRIVLRIGLGQQRGRSR